MAARRRCGYRPDEPDTRDWTLDKLALASTQLPPGTRLREPANYQQSSSSSCVGQALAGAMHMLELQAWGPSLRVDTVGPSAAWIYAYSRLQHSTVLLDTGTFVRTGAEAVRKLGVCPESAWPFSTRPWKLNRRPSWRAHMMAEPRQGASYYRIYEGEHRRVLAIKAALAAGLPVVFGTRVDAAFLKDGGKDVVGIPDLATIQGGHAMVITGYDYDPQQGTLFRVRNSWGDGWRDRGGCWLTEEYIRWPHTRDFTVIEGWKLLQQLREAASA